MGFLRIIEYFEIFLEYITFYSVCKNIWQYQNNILNLLDGIIVCLCTQVTRYVWIE